MVQDDWRREPITEITEPGNPFWSARSKLRWACHHLEALDVAIDRFTESDPYTIAHDVEDDGREHVYRVDSVQPVPESIGLITADVLNNARSALDHLVYAVAIRNNAPLTPEQERRPQFVIAMDSTEFKKNKWRIDLLPNKAQTIVQELQPFKLGMFAALPLIRLREWSNAEKHRELRTFTWTGWGALAAYGTPPDIPVPAVKDMHLGILTPGTELLRFAFTDPHPEVDVHFRLRFSVAVDEPPDPRILGDRSATIAWQQGVSDALARLLRLINEIIPLFVPFM